MFLRRFWREGGGILPHLGSMLLSEQSVRHAAQELLYKYGGGQAWGMADMRARAFKSEGFHTFATTWERIRDSIGTVRSEIEGSNRSDPPQ